MVNYLVLAVTLVLTAIGVAYLVGFGAPPQTVAELLREVDKGKHA